MWVLFMFYFITLTKCHKQQSCCDTYFTYYSFNVIRITSYKRIIYVVHLPETRNVFDTLFGNEVVLVSCSKPVFSYVFQ
jgi:hypothetical protein